MDTSRAASDDGAERGVARYGDTGSPVGPWRVRMPVGRSARPSDGDVVQRARREHLRALYSGS